jgi:hypothetical protein
MAAEPHSPGMQSYNQSAEFFLSNYRLGKTLGIGSFGKVGVFPMTAVCTALQLPFAWYKNWRFLLETRV